MGKDEQRAITEMTRRQLMLGLVLLLGFVGLGLRLFRLQVVQGDTYVRAAQENRRERLDTPAPRGAILDRYGRPMTTTLPRYDVGFFIPDAPVDSLPWQDELIALLHLQPEAAEGWLPLIQESKPLTRVALVKDVSITRVMELAERRAEFPGIGVEIRAKRSYPYGLDTCHLLGYLGAISPEELERNRPLGYGLTDQIGKGGLERQYDFALRGQPGYEYLEVDHLGRIRGRITAPLKLDLAGRETIPPMAPPVEGPPLNTTLDLDLQLSVAERFDGYEGAVIVMDVRDGGILALVSNPAYDPNLFSPPTTSTTEVESVLTSEDHLQVNRALAATWGPGSSWKIVTALAGLEEGVITQNTVLNCDGVFTSGEQEFKCLGVHGGMSLETALQRSCNDFFFQVGASLGPERMAKWAGYLGYGRKTGIDLPGELAGLVPTPDWKQQERGERWYQGNTLNMAIGQGDVLVTPLQMVHAYAMIGNGGQAITPHINLEAAPEPLDESVLSPRPEHLWAIQRGLRRVVTMGTAAKLAGLPLPIAGKTGSAEQAGRNLTHSWFVSYAPAENPIVAVVVLADAAGHGSEVAVPVAQTIYQLPSLLRYIEANGGIPREPESDETQLADAAEITQG